MNKSGRRTIVILTIFAVLITSLSGCSVLNEASIDKADVLIDSWILDADEGGYNNLMLSGGRRDLVSDLEGEDKLTIGGDFEPSLLPNFETDDKGFEKKDDDIIMGDESTDSDENQSKNDEEILMLPAKPAEAETQTPAFIPYDYVALPNVANLYIGMSKHDFEIAFPDLEVLNTSTKDKSAAKVNISSDEETEKTAFVYFNDSDKIDYVIIKSKFENDIFNIDIAKNDINSLEKLLDKASTISYKDNMLNDLPSNIDLAQVLGNNGIAVFTWLYSDIEVATRIDNSDGEQPFISTYYQNFGGDNFKVYAKKDIDAYYTSIEICDEYSLNEIRADEKLNGEYIQIEGVIQGISKDQQGRAYINLGQHESGLRLVAYFEESEISSLKSLNKGDSVYISSFVGEVIRDEISSRIELKYSSINDDDLRKNAITAIAEDKLEGEVLTETESTTDID